MLDVVSLHVQRQREKRRRRGRLTGNGVAERERGWRSALQQGDGDGARLRALPFDLQRGAGWHLLILGRGADGIKTRSLGEDDAGRGSKGRETDGEER